MIRKKTPAKNLLTRNALPDLAKMAKILEPGPRGYIYIYIYKIKIKKISTADKDMYLWFELSPRNNPSDWSHVEFQ